MDDQLVDMAWQNMKVMLDAEMPVQKKKRTRIPFFWFFFLAGLVVGGVWWYQTRFSSRSIPATIDFTEPVNVTPKELQPESVNEIENCEEDLPTKIAPPMARLFSDEKLEVSAKPDWAITSIPGMTPKLQYIHPIFPLPKAIVVAPVPTLDLLQSINGNASPSETWVHPVRQPLKKWKFGIESAILASNESVLSGFSGAFHAGLPLNKKQQFRIWMGTGVQAATYSLTGTELQTVASANTAERTLDGFVANAQDSAVWVSTKKDYNVGYLSIPVYLSGRISDRFQFIGGSGLNLLLFSAESLKTDVSENLSANPAINFAKSTDLENQFSRSYFYVRAGLRYKLNSKWDLGVDYQQALQPVLESNEANYQRNLRFTVFYQW